MRFNIRASSTKSQQIYNGIVKYFGTAYSELYYSRKRVLRWLTERPDQTEEKSTSSQFLQLESKDAVFLDCQNCCFQKEYFEKMLEF
mgnify:CR=1 FL=1